MILAALLLGAVPVVLGADAAAQASRADADVLWASGERLAAIEAMEALLAEAPDDDELRAALVRREIAVHRYRSALEHADGLGDEVASERGYCLFRLGRFEEALEHLDPDDPQEGLYVFDVLERLGRADEARALLPRLAASRGADDPEVLVRRGRMLAAGGEHAEAAARFRAAVDADPVHAEAWYGLGRALVRSGEREAGLAALERHRELVPLIDALEFALQSLDLAPNHAPNHAAVGDAERALGRLDRAESAYRRAATLASRDAVVPIALRHARLLEEDRGDVEGALAVLDAARERVDDVRLLVRRGDVLLAAGRAEEAVAAYERGLERRPDDAAIRARRDAARRALEEER